MNAEERLVELETRYAYLEHTLQALNDRVAQQQREIDQLTRSCQQLAERIVRGADAVFKGSLADEIPPHY